MSKRNVIGDRMFGRNREVIPDIAFHAMTGVMKLMDLFAKRSTKNFRTLSLKPGQTVVDYGCGPARYVRNASEAVGESGKVIATDIHPLAVKKVKEMIGKHGLRNVEAVLADGYNTSIASGVADVVYALDMFHMIQEPKAFLAELSRLATPEGTIIIEDGHQPRAETVRKITESGILEITEETGSHVKCKKK